MNMKYTKKGASQVAKILEFPKEKSVRARILQKSFQQKAVIPLSLLSVLVVSLSLNEWIQYASQKVNTSRGVASLPSQDLDRQIKWEHKWADSLKGSNTRPGVTSEDPSQLDKLLFGVLQGDVKMTRSGSRIATLEMTKPVELKNREEFLESYKAVWSISFDHVELDKQKIADNTKQETYKLIDKNGQNVGQAIFGLDDLQTVRKLEFSTH
jgi:hypothetical protein